MAAHYNYQDPYNTPGGTTPSGSSTVAPSAQYGGYEANELEAPAYAQATNYNNYSTNSIEKNGAAVGMEDVDQDGVNQLGEIGGTERAKPGRAGLHHPTSSFAAMGPPPRSTGILRMWRKDERGKQWTRGGGFRSTGRAVCCCITVAILMIISIILAVLLYVRPPSVVLNGVQVDSNSLSLDSTNHEFNVGLNLSITVSNPNWFDANFKKISADVKYDATNSSAQFGSGEKDNVNFRGYTASTFLFPLTLNYSMANDPGQEMINSLSTKCGLNGGTTGQITIDYTLHLALVILGVTVKPNIDASATIDCPVTASQIQEIIGST